MEPAREELRRVLAFILNRSDRAEIEVIQEAVQRRVKDLTEGGARLDIEGLARQTSRAVKAQMDSKGRLQGMMRSFIQEIIQQNQPDIPAEHVSRILDEYVPDEETEEKGREERYPREAVDSMIVQFVEYSLGRMKQSEKQQLTPDWSRKYWNIFSGTTRRLIADLLKERIDEKDFWQEIKKR